MKPWSLKQSRSTKLDSQRSSGLSVPYWQLRTPLRESSLLNRISFPKSTYHQHSSQGLILSLPCWINQIKNLTIGLRGMSYRRSRMPSWERRLPKPISTEMMRKYITYAKTINPVLSLDSQDYLRNIYNNLRQGQDSYITVRQLEALERLTEASARVKLRAETTLEDAKRAVSLFLESLKSVSLGDAVDVSVLYSTSSR